MSFCFTINSSYEYIPCMIVLILHYQQCSPLGYFCRRSNTKKKRRINYNENSTAEIFIIIRFYCLRPCGDLSISKFPLFFSIRQRFLEVRVHQIRLQNEISYFSLKCLNHFVAICLLFPYLRILFYNREFNWTIKNLFLLIFANIPSC